MNLRDEVAGERQRGVGMRQAMWSWAVAVALVLGFILWSGFAPRWLGRLPGDIRIEREHDAFYFPIVTCIIISIVLSLIFSLFRR